jgi:hypothetical protein
MSRQWFRSYRVLISVCAVLALAAASFVARTVTDSGAAGATRQGPSLFLPDVDLGTLTAKPYDPRLPMIVHPLTVQLINRGDRPVRVVGVQQGCVRGFCCVFDFAGPFEIPAGASAQLRGELKCTEGPFDGELELYYDDGRLQTLTYRISGRGVLP